MILLFFILVFSSLVVLMIKFKDLNIDFSEKIILLDVDGTLVEDSSHEVEVGVVKMVDELKLNNVVYLCTNSMDKDRNSVIEEKLSLKIVNLMHKKPNKRILQELSVKHGEIDPSKIIVIGDKYLTDGVFAKNIGAKFIKVERITAGYEKIHIKLFNIFDDLVYKSLRFLKKI